jgi:hypothetical protein
MGRKSGAIVEGTLQPSCVLLLEVFRILFHPSVRLFSLSDEHRTWLDLEKWIRISRWKQLRSVPNSAKCSVTNRSRGCFISIVVEFSTL